ncbi:hypothetical protein E2R51_11115 [Jeotgalibacillus sp. S-D1]|uniref:hypothetical protein n=1 Tax=Jeotgalibacillus sp. S-D1 TaxID=2552189 RepID=UPI001059E918|nr:hypothetical protein [Jeotgalibacillus sp. S-D1]TDL31768.1 hypothetical protein E2R51_11115 [Jeotgalibacillus sp. S-D1]
MNFPTIHTNFWDAVIAIPIIVIIVQILKVRFKIPKKYIPTMANAFGLIISIFISHKGNLAAGVFMGFFYGAAAVGTYASLKTSIIAFVEYLSTKKKKQSSA